MTPVILQRRRASPRPFPVREASLGYSVKEVDMSAQSAIFARGPHHIPACPSMSTHNALHSTTPLESLVDPIPPAFTTHSSEGGWESFTDLEQAVSSSERITTLSEHPLPRAGSPDRRQSQESPPIVPSTQQPSYRPSRVSSSNNIHLRIGSVASNTGRKDNDQDHQSQASLTNGYQAPGILSQAGYHQPEEEAQKQIDHRASHATFLSTQSDSQTSASSSIGEGSNSSGLLRPEGYQSRQSLSRPVSSMSLGGEFIHRGRTHSPHLSVHGSPGVSPFRNGISRSPNRSSSGSRPVSYVDLLSMPYSQQIAPAPTFNNPFLKGAVGSNASLLDTMQTLEMYRANVKKTSDEKIQYEFAVLMINLANEMRTASPPSRSSSPNGELNKSEHVQLISEAKQILYGLAGRSYPFAQYLLADGYASGLFNKSKEDYHTAFPLFVSAAKHGHAEAGYRAALCYEFGWGSRKDYAKAVQYYRQSASKNHPGAATRLGKACLSGDLGLEDRYREGLKWLKRAAESADVHHNAAAYELGLLHEHGYGDDIFRDEAYAAQLFTQSADLGHAMANLRMGQAYEHGALGCPRDPALSVHFYNGAALGGLPQAMMALCAWYMVGAEPVLEKDEGEAYEWAKKAAELAFPKAEYAIGYFTEMGIGCRRDPLEANVWYVRAADQGDERAKHRLALIRAAASGDATITSSKKKSSNNLKSKRSMIGITGGDGDDKECIIM